jgi:hypothetical protein
MGYFAVFCNTLADRRIRLVIPAKAGIQFCRVGFSPRGYI